MFCIGWGGYPCMFLKTKMCINCNPLFIRSNQIISYMVISNNYYLLSWINDGRVYKKWYYLHLQVWFWQAPSFPRISLTKGYFIDQHSVIRGSLINQSKGKIVSNRNFLHLWGWMIPEKKGKTPECPQLHSTLWSWGSNIRGELSAWRFQMITFSALLASCAWNPPVTGEFPAQRPVARSFDVFFDMRLNKRLSKQWWDWWFETS